VSVFFRLKAPTAYGAVAARLGQFADDLHARGLPNELVFAAHYEQPGRYGPLPTLAECVFAADTTAAIAQLRLAEQTGISGQALAAVSLAEIAAGFAPDPIAGYGDAAGAAQAAHRARRPGAEQPGLRPRLPGRRVSPAPGSGRR
jgi:hypothetical protein